MGGWPDICHKRKILDTEQSRKKKKKKEKNPVKDSEPQAKKLMDQNLDGSIQGRDIFILYVYGLPSSSRPTFS